MSGEPDRPPGLPERWRDDGKCLFKSCPVQRCEVVLDGVRCFWAQHQGNVHNVNDPAATHEPATDIVLQPEGTLIVSAINTAVGNIDYLVPGFTGGPRPALVVDFAGVELASLEQGHVTIVLEMPGAPNWLLKALSMLAEKGLWKP